MIKEEYKKQVELLLKALPEIVKEESFCPACINLFIRSMPRLSEDIDLIYLPVEDFETSRTNINTALKRVMGNLKKVLPQCRINHEEKNAKLYVSSNGVMIKIEVNLTGRGTIGEPVMMNLCERAQEEFESFVSMRLLLMGQLFGSKICAALDTQHPRDLFDVRYLLSTEGITPEVKKGFLFYLLGHSRPVNEMLAPNWKDQKEAMGNQFIGMTVDTFSYEDYEVTRISLLEAIRKNLSDDDKKFLLSVKNISPDWSLYDFKTFPGIEWKLKNLQKLKDDKPAKYTALLEKLKLTLYPFVNNAEKVEAPPA